ncbi:MAG: glycosyltransferase family 2 protein [bacterium]|nr:glycosyltransferase family 2 protein [bacterium]
MQKVSIVIPAYNEEKGIGALIDEIKEKMKGYEYEMLVVDDGSFDNTAKIVREKDVVLIQHTENRGYGAALKSGIRKAKYDTIAITDADGTYPISEMPELIKYLGEYDMVVGARNKQKIPLIRKPAKFFLNMLANYLTATKIPDLNSGLRVFKKDLAVNFFNLLPDGFSFTTTITLAMLTNNYLVKFIPIDYLQRQGKSKIRPIRDTYNFSTLIIRTVMYFNPLKIFVPIGIILFLMAMLVFVYSKFVLDKVMDITVVVILMSAVQIVAIGLLADLVDKRSQK